MKRCLLALCASSAFSWAVANDAANYEFTYETVAAYAGSWDYAIRWGAGTIKVVDETGVLKKEPEILKLLNMNLGETKLVLVDGPKGDITIKWVDELPAPYGNSGCALSQSQLDPNGVQIVSNIIRVKRNNRCIGTNRGSALTMHELGHALGFEKHAKEDDVMSTHDPAYDLNHINISTLQHFLKGLYSLKVGEKIPGKKKMPLAASQSLVYDVPMPDKEPTKEPVLAKTPEPQQTVPEVTFAQPNLQYRRIEKRDAKGRVTWEFVQVGGSAAASTSTVVDKGAKNASSQKKGAGPKGTLETIEPALNNAPSLPTTLEKSSGDAAQDDFSRGYISFGPRR